MGFAEAPRAGVAQAVERGLLGDWKCPEAVGVPLLREYRIVYDPVLASTEQAELPKPGDEPAPEPPHTITRSGIKVYQGWPTMSW